MGDCNYPVIVYSAIRSGEGLRSKGAVISWPLHWKMTALIRLERWGENAAAGESAVRSWGAASPRWWMQRSDFCTGLECAVVLQTRALHRQTQTLCGKALCCKRDLFHLNFCCWCSLRFGHVSASGALQEQPQSRVFETTSHLAWTVPGEATLDYLYTFRGLIQQYSVRKCSWGWRARKALGRCFSVSGAYTSGRKKKERKRNKEALPCISATFQRD